MRGNLGNVGNVGNLTSNSQQNRPFPSGFNIAALATLAMLPSAAASDILYRLAPRSGLKHLAVALATPGIMTANRFPHRQRAGHGRQHAPLRRGRSSRGDRFIGWLAGVTIPPLDGNCANPDRR